MSMVSRVKGEALHFVDLSSLWDMLRFRTIPITIPMLPNQEHPP